MDHSKEAARATSYVGVNIGALTVKVAVLKGDELVYHWVQAHQGRPKQVLEELLSREEIGADRFVGVSGHLGHISEVAAIQRALEARAETYDGVASLGGAFEASGRARSARSEPPVVEAGDAFTQRIEV